ncbi:MAG: metallophosphoesterase [Proteobacteria bacterium]|nr:metallophosphoesterase [Pseudomonadota bacterium]
MTRFSLASFLLLSSLAAWGFGFEPGWLQQRQLALASAAWKGGDLRIAVASDFHTGAPHAGLRMVRRVVAEINAGKPDVVLLPGDFVIQGIVGGEQIPPEAIAAELAALKAPLGVYATLGNHDWWYDGARVKKALEQAGIRVVDNGAVHLRTATIDAWLVGIGDDMTDHADPVKAFAGVPVDASVIVMMHDPATLSSLPRVASVAFAGHTHGGQVRLPIIGALITPGRAPRQHAYGWIPGASTPTYVSSGIGTSILPVRFNCPPETVMLQLKEKVA